MNVTSLESRHSLLSGIREKVGTAAGAFELRIARIAGMADNTSHAALHLFVHTTSKVFSALRDPYSNVFTFTEQGNPIQVSGRPGSKPFFTETDAANMLRNQRRPQT